jgi:DNA-binding GntR family transcriptional regulator
VVHGEAADGDRRARLRLAPRQVLADDVYEAIKGLIMDHLIEPGARVNIDAVARELEVSQTPVRESLARLEADGLVTKLPLRGYSVAPLLTRRELEELFQLRLLIEPWGAAQAARHADDEGVQRLRAELASLDEAPGGAGYEQYKAMTAHDTRFHDLVLELSGNDAVRAAFDRTHCHLHLFRLHYGSGIGGAALVEHRAVVASVAAGDSRGAQRAMKQHLEASRERLRGAFR